MDASNGITQWSKYFIVLEGQAVCVECRATQSVADADNPFRHSSTCRKLKGRVRYPWRELHNTLDLVRG